jgi:hypothetical protein
VSHWQMMWEIGALDETHLRLHAKGIFGGPLGVRFWSEARDVRAVAERGRRARQFHRIVDSEYQVAVAGRRSAEPERGAEARAILRPTTETHHVDVDPAPPRSETHLALTRVAWFAGGAAVAWLVARIVRRSR